AGAHAALVASSPARRATLAEPPARVELTFSERLEPAYARLAVEDASGARVDRGDAAVARDDARRLAVTLGPLGPGIYRVRFRVLSVDGHVVESTFPFTVRERSGARSAR
ncbi:MAG: copper resistance CopC family protein, partial [Candidatus Rokuibacteriota bacterium]